MASPAPDIVAHADWGKDAPKRSIALATRDPGGRFLAGAPSVVEDARRLLPTFRHQSPGAVLIGFDFPIGLPLSYATRAGVKHFRDWLAALPDDDLFYHPAARPDEISLARPFYPERPGGTKQAHLTHALGVPDMSHLLRRCERGHPGRGPASPLFWTMGAKQVGKAAISGWREVLAPALRDPALDVALWPFDGSLEELLASGRIVCAETYPGEFYAHLRVTFPAGLKGEKHGKRVQADRAGNAESLLGWAESAGVEVTPELERGIRDGFGPDAGGADPFDAVVGLFGMLNVVLGRRPSGEPDLESVRSVEGWILGQTAGADVCPFCEPSSDRVFHHGERVLALWDGFPVSPGHALVVPRRHVATWFDASREERREMMDAIDVARAAIEARHAPDGFNVGMNLGAAAGQTVPHLHLHVIPRYAGDVEDPRGGIRWVVPERADYWNEK